MRTVVMLVSLLVVAPAVASADPPKQVAASTTASIQIEGMDCAACTVAIRVALKKLSGVKEAKVIFDEKRATVDYDPAKITPQQLVDAVVKLGYKATLAPKRS